MLDIVASYDCIQFSGKLMIQTSAKPYFGLNLGPLGPIWWTEMDGQKNESDFIRRCLTNVERPTTITNMSIQQLTD